MAEEMAENQSLWHITRWKRPIMGEKAEHCYYFYIYNVKIVQQCILSGRQI